MAPFPVHAGWRWAAAGGARVRGASLSTGVRDGFVWRMLLFGMWWANSTCVHTDADVPARLLCSPFRLALTSLTALLCRATELCAESLAVLAGLAAASVAGYLFLSLPSLL